MKRQSDCDIQNRLKEAAGQETPPLWSRIEAGLRDTRYSFEAAEEPATRKTWWRRPAVAVAASLFLVLAAGLTLLYPVLMPPASSTLEERVELSFKARADILGAPDYGLEGNRSESLRLIESYTEFQKVLARIGLQTAGETRVSTEVPYPREIEAELPYNETYFEKHVLLMLLYPWETGYAAEDVTGVSRTGTVLTVNLSQAAPREDAYAGLRQALFVEVEKTDVEDCDRFVFEVRASEHSEAETLQTMRYRVEAVAVNTENAAANRILTDTKGIADLKSRLPDAAARERLDRYDESYFQDHDLVTLYLRQPYSDRIWDIAGVTSLKNDSGSALDIVLTKKNADPGGANGRIYYLELPKGIVSADTILYLYDAFQGSVNILADLDEDSLTALELVQGEERTVLKINGDMFMDFWTEPVMYGDIMLRAVDFDSDGVKEMMIETGWVLPKGMRPYVLKRADGSWIEIAADLFSNPNLSSWFLPGRRLVSHRLPDGKEHVLDIAGHDDWFYENGELAVKITCESGAYEKQPAIVTLPDGQVGLWLRQFIYAVDGQGIRYKLAVFETILTMKADGWEIYSEELKPI